MLAMPAKTVAEDVIVRFDPRPETGVFVSEGFIGKQVFKPTVPSPTQLAILLQYTFRQASLDSLNYMKRTALHMACDANLGHSHQKIIELLTDKYGANV